MIKIAVVGCTGKLGKTILNRILSVGDVELRYAIARRGNQFVGKHISELINGKCDLEIIDDIELAIDCDVFIDCTNADAFMNNGYAKYERMRKPLLLATTAFCQADVEQIKLLSTKIPVFMTGNFSIALHNFIETLKFAVKRVSDDIDVQIVESHHNQKLDAPSGTALMIRDALISANPNLRADRISICSVRVGKLFGEHEVIFANNRDEFVTYKHQVTSREPFADGAINVAKWILSQPCGLYGMGDFCDF